MRPSEIDLHELVEWQTTQPIRSRCRVEADAHAQIHMITTGDLSEDIADSMSDANQRQMHIHKPDMLRILTERSLLLRILKSKHDAGAHGMQKGHLRDIQAQGTRAMGAGSSRVHT